LVPDLWEWVMGYPPTWTASEDSAMPSFPKSQNGLESESVKR
jgi:hypothetical protein